MSPDPVRCPWCLGDPLYVQYHDTEWGMPERRAARLFEKLILDGFQAGLSWLTVLRKRPALREAFDGFDAAKMARFDASRQAALMQDARIIRNRAKIAASVVSARAYLDLHARGIDFAELIWSFVGGAPRINHFRSVTAVPTTSSESVAMSRHLKSLGFGFCGPTICYAFMQACGLVNDHLIACHRHAALAE